MSSGGSGLALGDESSLTPTQREVITELQKILMTLNQINESLQKTIALAEEGGEMRRTRRQAVEVGKEVFQGALGLTEEEAKGEVPLVFTSPNTTGSGNTTGES